MFGFKHLESDSTTCGDGIQTLQRQEIGDMPVDYDGVFPKLVRNLDSLSVKVRSLTFSNVDFTVRSALSYNTFKFWW